MNYIDLETWPRKNAFEFFRTYETPYFNICADVEISTTYDLIKKCNLSSFTAIMWLTSHVANGIKEIRYRTSGDRIIEYDSVHPSFTKLKEDKTLTFCRAEYCPDIRMFFRNVEECQENSDENPVSAGLHPETDVLYVSCVPWINFRAVSHPVKRDDTECIPRISWGKFTSNETGMTMPVSLQLHHGLADGYHAGLFFERLQKLLDRPDDLDWPT